MNGQNKKIKSVSNTILEELENSFSKDETDYITIWLVLYKTYTWYQGLAQVVKFGQGYQEVLCSKSCFCICLCFNNK